MTDPKSISRNREFYTEQYGVQPLNRNQSTNGTYESSVGDTVDIDGSAVPDEYQEFFADLPPEHGGPGNDNQLMNEVNEQVEESIPPGASPIQWEASQIKEDIKDLLDDNKVLLKEAEAYDEFEDRFKELERKIGRSGIDPEDLADQMLELKDSLAGAVDEVGSNNAAKFDAAIRALETLVSQAEDSNLPEERIEELKNRLEAKIDDLKEGKRKKTVVFGEAAEDEIKDLQKDVARTIGTEALIEDFERLPSRIPARGPRHQEVVQFSRKVRDALNDGNWDQVHRFLDDAMRTDGGWPNNVLNDFVQQFVGGLYYGVADEDEGKLDQLLSLIPQDVRQKLSDAALRDQGELLHTGNCNTETEKKENYFYANPTVTADRLLDDDIERAGRNIGEPRASSSPSSSRTTSGDDD